MLKFENTAEIGDVIKAFDFQPMEGRDDAFLTGVVLSKGDMISEVEPGRFINIGQGYTVKVLYSQSGSEQFDASREGTEMYVPFETTFDYDGRVQFFASREEYEAVCYEVDAIQAA